MNKTSGVGGQASVPMKLFATWEIDRSSAICMPRVCTMTICKLTVSKELDKDVQIVFIAVKMQGSKRVFRSNEIYLLSNGLVDATLELAFTLEYPHFVKREGGNRLQILLQRKKRYKNRAMLGFKTLAASTVDMSQLIQCPIPNETSFGLMAVRKDQEATLSMVAEIVVSSMYSLPMDTDVDTERIEKSGTERSPEVDNYSDDDTYSSDPDVGSDPQQIEFIDDVRDNRKIKNRRKIRMSSSSRQQNFIKTKVAALLKKFRQVSDEDLDSTLVSDHDVTQIPVTHDDLDFLYDDLEDLNLSDSCPELDDNISIVSTPKPKLKPFFDRLSHSSSQAELCSIKDSVHTLEKNNERVTISSWDEVRTSSVRGNSIPDAETPGHSYIVSATSSPDVKSSRVRHNSVEKKKIRTSRDVSVKDRDSKGIRDLQSISSIQADSVNEFVSRLEAGETLPENILIVDGNDRLACMVGSACTSSAVGLPNPVLTRSSHDVQLVFTGFLNRLQKFLNRNPMPRSPVRFAVVGSHVYLSVIVRQFTESLSSRSSDWPSLLLFYFIPTGSSRVSRYLASLDHRYALLFGDSVWKECLDNLGDTYSSDHTADLVEVGSKLRDYLLDATQVLPLSICEAMMTFRKKDVEESSSQKFFPFVSEVTVGEKEFLYANDSDKEDCVVVPISSNPISVPGVSQILTSPPSSPSVPPSLPPPGSQTTTSGMTTNQVAEVKIGLLVDYWKERDATKYTLKTNFKSFHVTCLPPLGERPAAASLALDVVTKGKKNLMRLPGKKGKEKEADSKSQAVGNINRLICTSKHQNSLLQVTIDGVEWKDVKFFQLSAHWSSHVKTFPFAVFNV